MGIFNLTDIKFDSKIRGLFQDSVLGDSASGGYNIHRYPSDVGTYGKGHYLVIHINEQVKTQFSGGSPTNSDLPTVIKDRLEGKGSSVGSSVARSIGGALDEIISRTPDKIKSILPEGKLGGFVSGATDTISDASSVGFVRTIRRTTDTIALYMPDTMNFDLNQNYSTNPLTGGAFMSAATIASFADAIKSTGSAEEVAKQVGQNMGPFAARAIADAVSGMLGGNVVDASFAALTGMVTNPVLEMIYSSPEFRKFSFEFLFYPRSEQEAKDVQDIINLLKFHQAPELNLKTNGFFLVPPSEFDIKFYYMGKENPNIPTISTCVLENINIDYAPNGFAAYETKNNTPEVGGTGMPVGIRMRLTFAETEIMTKQYYKDSVNRQQTSA